MNPPDHARRTLLYVLNIIRSFKYLIPINLQTRTLNELEQIYWEAFSKFKEQAQSLLDLIHGKLKTTLNLTELPSQEKLLFEMLSAEVSEINSQYTAIPNWQEGELNLTEFKKIYQIDIQEFHQL